MFAYFALGIIAEFIINGGMIIAPVLIFLDMTVDLIRRQYKEFRKEQTDILEAIKTNKKV
jgi:preprotein translocase subunit YajC